MIGGETGRCVGHITLIEPNDKGGVQIRIRVGESTRRSHTVFLDLFGLDAREFEGKNNFKIGDFVEAEWEIINKQSADKDTGKITWSKRKIHVKIGLVEPADHFLQYASQRPAPTRNPQQPNTVPAPAVSVEEDDW